MKIIEATRDDISALYSFYEELGKEDAGYFEACFDKSCQVLVVVKENKFVGVGVLNFQPKYNLYQKLNVPEIQDLNVLPAFRQNGIATALLEEFENIVKEAGYEMIGISVGLNKDYGAAQRLYVKTGYIPDGYGVTYDRQPVQAERAYAIDDDLALMMLKTL